MTDRELAAFLFTDVVGSSAHWEADEAAMSSAMSHHDDVARNAVAEAGGHIFKEVGDGICASFPSVASAISAAVRLQRALRNEPIDVRAGVHAGEAERRDGDWFGPALNRCARIMGIAHGGQILVAGAAARLAAGRLPHGVHLAEVASVRLRGLNEPDLIHQVYAEGLRAEFPPLSGETLTNLPASRTSFVGRADDLKSVAELVRESRVVTLAGVGGTGKTRLAVETARVLLDEIPDGVFFAALAEAVDSDDVARICADAAGLVAGGSLGGGSPDYRALVLAGLAERNLLLVLDNCEHLLDAVADVADAILDSCPDVRIMCTSREPIGIDGERVWRVPALPERDAVDLFEDRARAVNTGLILSEQDRDKALELCRHLDGLPLAIELAAARMRAMSVSDIASRLGDRFRLLAGRGRARERHATLRATLDWSYELLDENERALLDRLSVFIGGFHLEAAEEVCGSDPLDPLDIIDLLTSLVDKSLVVTTDVDGKVRYRLLETVQAYCADKLVERGETEQTVARHARWVYHLAVDHWIEANAQRRSLNGPDNRVAHEADNARAAASWAVDNGEADVAMLVAAALSTRWTVTGNSPEAARLCRAALELEGGQDWIRVLTLIQYSQVLQWCDQDMWDPILKAMEIAEHARAESPDPARGDAFLAQRVATGMAWTLEPPAGIDASAAFQAVRDSKDLLSLGSYGDFLEGAYHMLHGRAKDSVPYLTDLDYTGINCDFAWGPYAPIYVALAHLLATGDASFVPDAVAKAVDSPDPTIRRDTAILSALVTEAGSYEELELLERSYRLAREFSYPIKTWLCAAACVASRHGRHDKAARLFGAAGDVPNFGIAVILAVYHEPLTRQELGDSQFDRLHAEGAQLTLDTAVALALER